MKTSTVTLALTAAAVASVNAQDNCATANVRGFLIDTNAKACATATGVAWKPFRVYNETEIAAYCATPSCLTFLATLPALNPTECKIPGGDYPLLYADLLDKVAQCPAATPAPTTAAPTPAPTTATPTTPEPTTPAPTTPTPTTVAPTTPTPTTPTPTTVAPTTPTPTTTAPMTPEPTTSAPTPAPTTAAPVPAPTTTTPTTPEPTLPVKPSC